MAPAALWRLGFISLLLATLDPLPVRAALPKEASGGSESPSEPGAGSTTASSLEKDHADQFQCQVDGRWLPLEWRCDFSEQCLDGQDEFGCVPERCDFGHDFCNWRAQKEEQQRPRQQPWWALNRARTSGGTWLRYAGGGARREPTTAPSQRNNNRSTAASLQQQRLRELQGRLGRSQGRFLYAPLATANKGDDNGARLTAPFVGQTNSMCRLRFRYALVRLAGRRLASGDGCDRRLGVSLALFARNASDPGQSFALADSMWSTSLRPSDVGDPREAAWTVAMAELGHLARVELVFEARLMEAEEAEAAAKTAKTAKTTIGDHLTAATEPPAALAALAELHFIDCAWPQTAPPPQSLEVYPPGVAGSGTEWPLMVEPQVECQEGQFQCASNKLCLESRKLCNFVNDCMSADGGEDERRQLCSPVVGREDFEPPTGETSSNSLDWSWLLYPAIAGAQVERQQSWTLASNLPPDIIRVRSSSEREPHLPRQDHTLGQHHQHHHGHYLSVDISPESLGNSNAKPEDQISWLYLDSGWLERTGEETLDCRVKFFYNLISSGQPSSLSMPFKIYLALEHFVATRNGSRLLGTARKLDHLTRSHPEPYEAKLAPSNDELPDDLSVELPGVDFWREANYQVPGLADNQPFYLRIVIIVRPNNELGGAGPQAETPNESKASLSIDDLATHFGCGRLVKDTSELDKFRQVGQRRANVTVSFNLSDYIQQQLGEPQSKSSWPAIRSRTRSAAGSSTIQYEPHKLILCVLAVLVSLLGVIGVIVFVIVPYVERITISYHDQLVMGLSAVDSTPRNSTPDLLDACELINDADWEQVSRRWRRQGERDGLHGHNGGNTMVESLSAALDSRNNSQTMSFSDSNSRPSELV